MCFNMSKEIVISRDDRDSTMLALKLEIQELRHEVVELRQQKSSIPDPLPHTVPTYTSQQNVGTGPPAAKSYSNTVRTHHAATPQGTSPSSTQTSLPNKAKCVLHAPVILVVVQSTQPTHNAVKQGVVLYYSLL